jgi:hypothetical protein
MKPVIWLMGNRGTYEEMNPSFIRRLRDLEAMLKTELRPGTVVIHLKPIQYLDTPQGYGTLNFHRYRVVAQTLVDPPEGDNLEAVIGTSNCFS